MTVVDEKTGLQVGQFDPSSRYLLSRMLDRQNLDYNYSVKHYLSFWAMSCSILFLLPLIYCWTTQPTLTRQQDSLLMPYLLDLANLTGQLILFPLLLINVLRERRILSNTLRDFANGPAKSLEKDKMSTRFKEYYRKFNPLIVIVALILAVAATALWANWFLNDGKITWQTYGSGQEAERFNLGGYYCAVLMVGLYWFLVLCTVLRSILHYVVFLNISRMGVLEAIPLHPDRCGGLGMISNLVKLYQPLVLTIGMTIVGSYASDILFLKKPIVSPVNILLILGFVILCLVAFILPLSPFASSMRKAKLDLLKKISDRYQQIWKTEIDKLDQKVFSEVDYKALENLKSLYADAHQMPVWPYDLKTVKSFLSYVIVPLLGIIASTVIGKLIESAAK